MHDQEEDLVSLINVFMCKRSDETGHSAELLVSWEKSTDEGGREGREGGHLAA